MKRTLTLAVLVFVVVQLQAKIIYVKAGNNGNGKSWKSALGNLQDALSIAEPNDEIWVATGVYYPTTDDNRAVSFIIPDEVAVYGGFNGTEKELEERDWMNNLTVLSGAIGKEDLSDNSFTVVYIKNASPETIIDGFIITQGYANGFSMKGELDRCGGGLFNDGSEGESSPIIKNCLFQENYARDGGAIFNYSKSGASAPKIENCQFIANIADLDGGAIYNDGSNGICSPKITKCYFSKNEATYGASIMNTASYGSVRSEISHSYFYKNISYIRGSSIYNTRDKGVYKPIMTNCTMTDNIDPVGRSNSTNPNTIEESNELYFREISY